MTLELAAIVLASGLLLDRGALRPEEDPSAPLLRLFEAGYVFGRTHGAVDVMFAEGMCSVPLPTRRQIAARAQGRAR